MTTDLSPGPAAQQAPVTLEPSGASLLVVEDDAGSRELAVDVLETHGHTVTAVADGQAALETLRQARYDLVLSDLRMPGLDGLGLLRALAADGPHPPVILMTAYGSIAQAVEAVKAGAYWFLTKPLQSGQLLPLITRALEEQRLRRDNALLRRELERRWRCDDMLGRCRPMQEVFRLVHLAADSDSTVLILGESGTGKELVARAIHTRSARREGPFVAVNCAGIAESLLESELFGHVRGAFTGAVRDRAGLFQAATGGTLFLDEIGDAPPSLQAKLLRALESHEVRRVGSPRGERVNVRVTAATNTDLAEAIHAGRFRADLFYRLNVLTVELPRLADRVEDIPLLVHHFLTQASARAGRDVRAIAPDAMRCLLDHRWPGNVRELENAVERAVTLAEGPTIEGRHLPVAVRGGAAAAPSEGSLTDLVSHAIRRALAETGGNRRAAAQLLGIPERTFYRKLKALDLVRDHQPARVEHRKGLRLHPAAVA